jgi:membrane fusion protein, heavy metal efflux system
MNLESTNAPKSITRWIMGTGVGLGALLLVVWFANRPDTSPPTAAPAEEHHEENVVEMTPEAQRNAGIEIGEAELRPLEGRLTATGVVTAEQNRVAHIRPLAEGIAEDILAQLGDRVSAGQPLLTYDNIELGELTGDYLALQAEIAREQSQVEVAKSYLGRSEALLAAEAIAQKEHELRRAQYDQAVATMESKRAGIARVEEKLHRFGLSDEDLQNLNSAEHETYRTASQNTLTAPFAGVITAQDVAAGETVGPDREVFTLADTSVVWVLAAIYEKDLGLISVGKPCRVRVPAYPEEIFTGEIAYLSDVLDPASRTGKLRCVVSNPASRLKLEMFATVEIPLASTRSAVVVPESAIQMVEQRRVVFVQQEEDHFEVRDVELGDKSGDGGVEILNGVQAGERLVTGGGFYMKAAMMQEQLGEGGHAH